MQVNGRDYRTVWMEGNSVFYIDQNLLPFRFVIAEARDHRECCRAIKAMRIRGAGAIGAMAGYAMARAFSEAEPAKLLPYVRRARLVIESTRRTARNLFYATEKVFEAGLVSPAEALKAAAELAEKDAKDSQAIGEHGLGLLGDEMSVLTHCNAGWLAFVDYGTALSPVYLAHRQGKKVFVYADETRPRGQGARLTAWELKNAGIPHAIIPDNAAAHYLSKGMIDIVITGADRIASNGDTANKIGTLGKAILAKEFGIPFYIAAPTSTFDLNCATGKEIVIEERDEKEVLYQEGPDARGTMRRIRVASPGSPALNPAFDVTPSEYITGIITEKGIILPQLEIIKHLYQKES